MKSFFAKCRHSFFKTCKRALNTSFNKDRGPSENILTQILAACCNFDASKSTCLLQKYLDTEMIDKLCEKRTPTYKSNLLDCVQSGLKCPDSPIGVYAPDPEAYDVFRLLFDSLIKDIHGFQQLDSHPRPAFGDYTKFKNLDPEQKFIYSTRIRVIRNLKGYPLAPKMSSYHYGRVEQDVVPILMQLDGELRGWYYPQALTCRPIQTDWVEKHVLKDPTRFMEAGDLCKFLPTGRGLYHNRAKTFFAWLNSQDHLQISSMQRGADFGQVYKILVTAMKALNAKLNFIRCPRLGYLTCSPEHLGTALRASVLIKLEKLPKDKDKFQEVLKLTDLQARGTYGIGTSIDENIYDISNKRTLGLTEYQAVKTVYDGVREILMYEE